MMDRPYQKHYWQWRVEEDRADMILVDFISTRVGIPGKEAEELIGFGSVHINGIREKRIDRFLSLGDTVRLYWPYYGIKYFYEVDPCCIIYKDEWFLAYNKEPSIPSHQVPSDDYNNVLEGLRRWLGKKHPNPYLAIHNRLDQEVSGVLLFTLKKEANKPIARAFSSRNIYKFYLLWAEGDLDSASWACRTPITKVKNGYRPAESEKDGKNAETLFRVIYTVDKKHLILAQPITGRTHQIRIHIAASNLLLWGDRLYGGPSYSRLMLHGWRMRFYHPFYRSFITIEAPIPKEMLEPLGSSKEKIEDLLRNI